MQNGEIAAYDKAEQVLKNFKLLTCARISGGNDEVR